MIQLVDNDFNKIISKFFDNFETNVKKGVTKTIHKFEQFDINKEVVWDESVSPSSRKEKEKTDVCDVEIERTGIEPDDFKGLADILVNR
jgi:hypothetical protein